MRVAIVARGIGYEAGAIPIRARLEALELIRRSHEVIFFGLHLEGFKKVNLPTVYHEVNIRHLPRPLATLSLVYRYEKSIGQKIAEENKRKKIDLIVQHEQFFGILNRSTRNLGAKKVNVAQRTIFDTARSGSNPFNKVVTAALMKGAKTEFGSSDLVIALHEEMVKEIRKYADPKGVIVAIPNGVHVTEEDINQLLNQKEKGLIVFAGRLSPEKRVEDLIKAASKIKKNEKHFSVRIIGETPGRLQLLKKLTIDLGLEKIVHFTGHLSHGEVLSQMRKAEIFVLPSVSEGLPFALLEALSQGCVGVCSDIPGNRHVLGSGHGLLFEPYNHLELSKMLQRVLDDDSLSRDLAKRGFARAKHYAWDKIVSRTVDEYETILESN